METVELVKRWLSSENAVNWRCALTFSKGGKQHTVHSHSSDSAISYASMYSGCIPYASVNQINQDGTFEGRDCVPIVIRTKNSMPKAKQVANRIYAFLRDSGFNPPIVSWGMDGVQMKLRCAIKKDEQSEALVRQFLEALSLLFSTTDAEVVATPQMAMIDTELEILPHRKMPQAWLPTKREYFEKVAMMGLRIRKGEAYSEEIDRCISSIGIVSRFQLGDAEKIELGNCVFDPSHNAAVIRFADGAFGYACAGPRCSVFHNGDVATILGNASATPKASSALRSKVLYYGGTKGVNSKGSSNATASDGIWVGHPERINAKPPSIPTGFPELDRRIGSLALGDVTIVSGRNASGKTIWLDTLCLNAIDRGHKCAVWSGELQRDRFYGWLDCIAAGKQFVEQKPDYDRYYCCGEKATKAISRWLADKVYLYNNDYGNDFGRILTEMEYMADYKKVDLFILDNLASLDLSNVEGREYDRQKQFIVAVKNFAKYKNVHVVTVCHPRKSTQFLRKEDISGSADLTNLCDNLLILHRINTDFKQRAAECLGKDRTEALAKYSTVIEIAKNRLMGVEDCFIGLYYEPESKRLKSEIAEHVVYGWQHPPLDADSILQRIPMQEGSIPHQDSEVPFLE